MADAPSESELTTPTGAAFLACLVDEFGSLPPLTIDGIGYGGGDRDFASHPNLLRLICRYDGLRPHECGRKRSSHCLETNLDDTTGELIAHCAESLLAAGALDVWTAAIIMKKGRPAVQLCLLCEENDRPALESILFRETGTIGVRHYRVNRSKLRREAITVETPYGTVSGKLVQLPDGGQRVSAEYESCRVVATEHRVSVHEIMQAVEQSASESMTPKA